MRKNDTINKFLDMNILKIIQLKVDNAFSFNYNKVNSAPFNISMPSWISTKEQLFFGSLD